MPHLENATARIDLLNRLKRAEGQLRGIQRMVEGDSPCLDIASQMAAVRKALDSAYVRMTVCYMQQELEERVAMNDDGREQMGDLLVSVQTLLNKVR